MTPAGKRTLGQGLASGGTPALPLPARVLLVLSASVLSARCIWPAHRHRQSIVWAGPSFMHASCIRRRAPRPGVRGRPGLCSSRGPWNTAGPQTSGDHISRGEGEKEESRMARGGGGSNEEPSVHTYRVTWCGRGGLLCPSVWGSLVGP